MSGVAEPNPGDAGGRTALRVVVIGAGIVGAVCALALLRNGHRVVLIEPQDPGGSHAASYGNGGWLSPSLVVPLALPGLWRKVPRYLLDPAGPLTINRRALPPLLPWLARFLRAASLPRVEAIARARRPLVAQCHREHEGIARECGLAHLLRHDGQVQAYRSRADFEAEAVAWRLRAANGVTWTELDEPPLRRREPTLHPRYRFGAWLEGSNCVDPGAYTAGLVRHAVDRGAFLHRAHATGFQFDRGRLAGIRTDRGEVACERAIVCAGITSTRLAAALGDAVPLAAERGYHIVVRDLPVMPRHRVLLADGPMTNTPSPAGLRVTGQIEFARPDAPLDRRRTAALLAFTLGAHVGLPDQMPPDLVSEWVGTRPSTPDSLPVIGRSASSPDVIYAFGHGHIGVASSPTTARIVADLVAGRRPEIDISPYAPQRFSARPVTAEPDRAIEPEPV